jgi:hypothetical protein
VKEDPAAAARGELRHPLAADAQVTRVWTLLPDAALMADVNACLESRQALYSIVYVNQGSGPGASEPLCCVRQDFEISFISSDSPSFKRICLYLPSPVEAYSFTFLTQEDGEAWMRSIDAAGAWRTWPGPKHVNSHCIPR